jgi:hypothetical protein
VAGDGHEMTSARHNVTEDGQVPDDRRQQQ